MQCGICNQFFSRKDSLKRHLLNIHGVQEEDDSVSTKEKTFVCSQCSTKFTEKRSLIRHMKNKHTVVHQTERKRKSDEQQQRNEEQQKRQKRETKQMKVKSKDDKSSTSSVVPFDLTQHENNGRFLCSICDLPFTCKENRNLHFKNVHLTEKQFKCKNCSKSFKSRVNKNLHENHCQAATAISSSDFDNTFLSHSNDDDDEISLSQISTPPMSPPVVRLEDADDFILPMNIQNIDSNDNNNDNDSYVLSLSQISTSSSSPSFDQTGGAYVQSSSAGHDDRDDNNDNEDNVNDNEDFSVDEENDIPDGEMRQYRRGPQDIFFIYRKNFAPSRLDVMERFQNGMNEAQHQVRVKQETNKIYKIHLVVQASFHKAAKVDEITTPPHPTFKSEIAIIFPTTPLTSIMNCLKDNLVQQLDSYQTNGSGWIILNLIYIDLHIAQFDPLRASSYLSMPKDLLHRKGYVKVLKKDLKCFL